MLEVAQTIPYKGMRRVIGTRMVASKDSPQSYQGLYVDITDLMEFREKLNTTGEHPRVSFNDFVIKAAAIALQNTPLANSALVEKEIQIYKHANIGVMAATKNGLVAPVLRSCEEKDIFTISTEFKEIYQRAVDGTPLPDDYTDGTFSITNIGKLNADDSVPLLFPPQAAILAVCSSRRMPVVRVMDGEEKIVIRTMCKLVLSADHRILDGTPMARILNDIKDALENPESMMPK